LPGRRDGHDQRRISWIDDRITHVVGRISGAIVHRRGQAARALPFEREARFSAASSGHRNDGCANAPVVHREDDLTGNLARRIVLHNRDGFGAIYANACQRDVRRRSLHRVDLDRQPIRKSALIGAVPTRLL
jgi:hypothetical protein